MCRLLVHTTVWQWDRIKRCYLWKHYASKKKTEWEREEWKREPNFANKFSIFLLSPPSHIFYLYSVCYSKKNPLPPSPLYRNINYSRYCDIIQNLLFAQEMAHAKIMPSWEFSCHHSSFTFSLLSLFFAFSFFGDCSTTNIFRGFYSCTYKKRKKIKK